MRQKTSIFDNGRMHPLKVDVYTMSSSHPIVGVPMGSDLTYIQVLSNDSEIRALN